jgi:cell division protein FtsQ
MRDLKPPKITKVKSNRRVKPKKPPRPPRDWSGVLRLGLRALVGTVCLVLIVGSAGLMAKLLFDSNYFKVDQVRVENQGRVGKEEIVALSDVRQGQNIFELDLPRIGRKIEENPWVRAAEVRRLFPRTVVIKVEERTPKAVINLDYLYYVDGQGDIFKVLEVNDSLDFPVITGLGRKELLDRPEEIHGRLREMVALVDELTGRRVFGLGDVSEIHLDQSGEIVLYTCAGGVPVRMGEGNYRAKLDRLERIYADLKPRLRALKYIDLNVMDRIVVKVETGMTGKS